MENDLPRWLQPIQLENWPVQTINSTDLRYELSIRQGWETKPRINCTPMETEHVFRGFYASDWLLASFMPQADPEANLRNWVEGIVSLTGFPILAMSRDAQQPPQLLEWFYQGNYPAVCQKLAVDEIHCYCGLAKFPDVPSELARLYILLARRQTHAWKVSLSLLSACLPRMQDTIVAANDGIRAGTLFGSLSLL